MKLSEGLGRRAVATMIALFVAGIASLTPIAHAQVHDPLEHVPRGPAAASAAVMLQGELLDLLVEDRVAGASVRYRWLLLDDGSSVAVRGAAIEGHSRGERIEAVGQRNGNTLFVKSAVRMGPGSRAGSPKKAALPEAVVEGTLQIVHIDDFDAAKAWFEIDVTDASGRATPLAIGIRPEALQSGMTVRVTGHARADGSIEARTLVILALPARPTTNRVSEKATVTNALLVILVRFTDSGAEPFTQAQVQEKFSGGPAFTNVSDYFREVSYGQQLLAATVTPWLQSASATPPNCDWRTIGSLARSEATNAGYSLSSYQNLVYVFPRISACGWSGLAYVSGNGVWSNGSNSLLVYAHELGHNFGLLHAGSLDCGTAVIGGACTASEYGDPFGAMGNQRAMHFNAAQKLAIGWIPSSAISTHGSGSATYVLSPLETTGGTTYAVKVPVAANRTYWLEYRQPIGFDTGLGSFPANGAQIRVASPLETLCSGCDAFSNDTQMLDMTPGTNAITDGTLVVGADFTDPNFGVTFNVLSASSSGLSVQIVTGGDATPPTVPGSLVATASGATTISLGWTASTDNVGVTGYRVERCTGASCTGFTQIATPAATSYSDSGLTASTTYRYRVRATDAAGNLSAYSAIVAATTPATADTTPPTAPTGLTVAGSTSTTVSLGWTASTDNVGVAGYRVERCTGASCTGFTQIATPTGTTYGDTGRTASTTYRYRVRAVDAAGNLSAYSAIVAATTPATADTTPPTAPTGLTVAGSTSATVSLGWTASTDNVGVTGYRVERCRGASCTNFSQIGTPASTSYSDSGLTASTTYRYRVRATDAAGNLSAYSLIASATTAAVATASTADFDGNGKSDLIWRNASTGATAMWLMNGTQYVSWAFLHTDPNWVVAHAGDFNGDGQSDLIWRNASTGVTAMWLMNGTQYVSWAILPTDASWMVSVVGDFNGDGRSDLIWRNTSTGATVMWLMNGTQYTSWASLQSDPNWVASHAGDFNGDGRSDLVWRNASTGATAMWLMNGTQYTSWAVLPTGASWEVSVVGDFNGDGRSDLIWRNTSTGATAMWLMNGTQYTSWAVLQTDPNWAAIHAGDFNGDGQSDLIWRNASTGATAMWLMNGTTMMSWAPVASSPPWVLVPLR